MPTILRHSACPARCLPSRAVHNLKAYPELRAMIGKEATMQAFLCTSGDRKEQQKALRAVFRAFVTANTDIVALQVHGSLSSMKMWWCR